MNIITKCAVAGTIGFIIGMNPFTADAHPGPPENVAQVACEKGGGKFIPKEMTVHGLTVTILECRFLTYQEWLEQKKDD